MRRVRWSPDAASDLEAIYNYQRLTAPSRAQATIQALYDAAMSLQSAPNQGRPGSVPGTRELLTLPMPYLIIYRVEQDAVQIARIRHGKQNRLH